MGRLAGLAALLICVSACSVGVARGSLLHSPSPSASPVAPASPSPTPAESPPIPSPPAPLKIDCKGAGGSSMVMIQGSWSEQRLVYDVSDPLHPRLICNIANNSAHLVS